MLENGPFDGRTDYRMVFRGIGSGDQDHFGLLDFSNGYSHGTASKGRSQTGYGSGVSKPGTMIDVVGFKNPPDQLLHQIIFFIGGPGRGQTGQGIGAILISDFQKSFGHQVQGLISRGLPEIVPFFDQRVFQAIRVVDKVKAKAALDAQMPEIWRSVNTPGS